MKQTKLTQFDLHTLACCAATLQPEKFRPLSEQFRKIDYYSGTTIYIPEGLAIPKQLIQLFRA